MDILTQIVLGGSVASQILKDEKPRKAILTGCAIAAIPDLDMFLMFNANEYEELLLHRSFSHAIFPFLILSWLLFYFSKSNSFFKNTSSIRLFSCFFLILFTHALLDCFTTWGTRLFWPLENRIATQTIYVIDLFYSAPLAIGLAIFFLFNNTIWAKKLNRWTLILSTIYLLFLFSYQQYFIRSISEKEIFSNAVRVNTQPTLFSPLEYRTVIEFQDTFYVSRRAYHLLNETKQEFFSIAKNKQELIEVSEHFDLHPLFNLTRGYLSIDKIEANIYRISDLRYAPVNSNAETYQSVFTYYLILQDGKVEFKQNMRTQKRLELLFRKIFW